LIRTVKVRIQEEQMLRTPLTLGAAAGALIMVQGMAVAQPQCDGAGGIWANHCKAKGPKKGAEPADKAAPAANASPDAAANANANSAVAGATPPKPSATGMANANPNSAAATGTVNANAAVVAGAGALGASALGGISTGQSVKTSGGAALGMVSKIVKGPDGTVTQIIVTSAQGRSFPVAASKLSLSGGAVIVTDSSE
jgi:hypothetical protein